ncbi:MAG: COR domain-containing protein [Prochloraceae cyanobacterium]
MTNEELLEIISKAAQERQTQLELRECAITSLPPEIGQLTHLTRIYLNGNKLESLPPEIGNLTNLTRLYLRDNKIQSLPPEIGNLTKLTHIYIRGNKLETLPPEIGNLSQLKGLFLSDNNITSLPEEIKKLTNLGNLDLTRNPIEIPPDILNSVNEPSTIVQYYFKHSGSGAKSEPLNEVKMLLVGPAGTGKTSLLQRLLNNNFEPQQTTTLGINRQTWEVKIDEQNVEVNAWDFGGGESMHSAHHFFFTKRSIYLLVVDANKNEAENEVEYWLESIKSFGGNCPIIIIGNKADQKKLSFDRGKLSGKYPNIKTFVEVSCEANYNIDQLKNIICREIAALPHNIHQELDPTWLSVKKQLEQTSQLAIDLAEYQDLARSESLLDESEQSDLLRLISDLGHVLCLGGATPEANKIYPSKFIVDGIYQILNDLELKQYQGVLESEQLQRMFASDVLRENCFLITEAMCKMDLAVEIEEQQMYLIVDLLGSEEVITGEWQDSLNLAYIYQVKPPSTIFSRFLIRMQEYIYENYYWRNGVILVQEENQALVKFDRHKNKISIWINGKEETRAEFLSQICDLFDLIHKNIPGLQVEAAKGEAGNAIDSDRDLTQEISLSEGVSTSEQDATFILDDLDRVDETPSDRPEPSLPKSSNKPIGQNTTLILNDIPDEAEIRSQSEETTEDPLSSLDPEAQSRLEDLSSSNLSFEELENAPALDEDEYEEISLARFSPNTKPADRDNNEEKEAPSQSSEEASEQPQPTTTPPVVPPPPKLDFTPVEQEKASETSTSEETAQKSGPNLVLISIALLAVIGIGAGTVFYIQSQPNETPEETTTP